MLLNSPVLSSLVSNNCKRNILSGYELENAASQLVIGDSSAMTTGCITSEQPHDLVPGNLSRILHMSMASVYTPYIGNVNNICAKVQSEYSKGQSMGGERV